MWDRIRVIPSGDLNVQKYVFESKDAVAEAVLYKYLTYRSRTVICCSTQSGCPVGCRFCGAGDAFVRSLTAEEIVSQPMRLLEDTGEDPSQIKKLQIMFMSMGEPLLNPTGMVIALQKLFSLYPHAVLLVSTSAPRIDYEWVRRISKEIPTVGLQFSVHESTDSARNALIPFKAKLALKEIAEEGVLWHQATGRSPFFNYCAHPKNSMPEDADRILGLFDPAIWQATVSVICERDESVAAANERQRELAENFSSLLVERGYGTRVFNPAGQDDIGGGCGQLWFVQEWMRTHPQHAKPSIGRGLPSVHVPGRSA